MINGEDLFYVDKWARKAPFPGKDYAIKTMDKLIEAYTMYKDVFMNTEYKLHISSGELVEFKIYDKNLPSLLGIETQNLISEPLRRTVEDVLGLDSNEEKKAFSYLKRIIERADEVIKNDSNEYNQKILNYYRVMVKSSIFLGLPCFDKFDYGIIDNLNSEKCVNGYNAKYLYVHSDEELTPYFILSLRFDEKKGIYVPVTILAMKYLDSFIDNQELVLPISLTIKYDGYVSKIVASSEELKKLMAGYRNIIKECHTNTKINLDGNVLVKKR